MAEQRTTDKIKSVKYRPGRTTSTLHALEVRTYIFIRQGTGMSGRNLSFEEKKL